MEYVDGNVRLSAGDLVNHLACRHLTVLNSEVASGVRGASTDWDPTVALMRERGLAHERNYLQHLEDIGYRLTQIEGVGVNTAAVSATVEAMRNGADVIVQAALTGDRWAGRIDALLRVQNPSTLGDWSYEAVDTKLSRETKSSTILQLSLYSELVSGVQGVVPERMYVVAPWTGFEPKEYRTTDYAAYYRLVKTRLESAVDSGEGLQTYPDPREHCDICQWSRQCEARRRSDDHLSLVAGISSLHTDELKARDVDTVARLAAVALPWPWKPDRGAVATYEKIREQARMQMEGRTADKPVYETFDPEPGLGLAKLPEPSPGDVFFDIEGDPFVGPVGLEFLFGCVSVDESDDRPYTRLWALDYEEEKRCFEGFVDWLMERWARHPDMHLYHYAPYEPSAMKRLMGRHGTREEEVDRMLRAGLFVDLYRVTRESVRASVESYSIKNMEPFFDFKREVSLSDANRALYAVSAALESGGAREMESSAMAAVEGYNRDDCASTFHLRGWLEGVRQNLAARGASIERPPIGDGEASEHLTEWQQAIRELANRIAGDVPAAPDERSDEQQARWVLANILDWHRREEKAVWWEFFRLRDSTVEDLLDERAALSQLELVETVGGMAGAPVHRYRFPAQETSLRGGEKLHVPGVGSELGDLVDLNTFEYTIDVKKRVASANDHPEAVFTHDTVPSKVLKDALVRIGKHVGAIGMEGGGPYAAARDLLLRRPPRLNGEPVRRQGESGLDAALRIAAASNFGVLPVQGPPGAGKTYTGARMICELVSKGARVGITANSHKVIVNLLQEIMSAADERGMVVKAVRKISGNSADERPDPRVILTGENAAVFVELGEGCRVAAGTAWLWAREEARDSVDVLFVDEAAQMSLANVLAISHAAPNLVLLGDPQQLDQPTQGTHPDGTGVSALAHLLGERQTIEAEQGLFLEETWRLHPDICAFTSEVFYEDRLASRFGLERQRVIAEGPVSGTGLRLAPISHRGNQSSSDEEADAVAALVSSLVDNRSYWVDQHGTEKAITLEDVLIIAPYNAQVFKVQERLPGARVGTVDKFQGQEAPVVIYTMATSTPGDAPHGMDFLYSLNRLNVATSRARCVCVLVASLEFFGPECRTPRQMQLANAFCRYRELASEVTL